MFGVLLARLNESESVEYPSGVDRDEDAKQPGYSRDERAGCDVGGRRAQAPARPTGRAATRGAARTGLRPGLSRIPVSPAGAGIPGRVRGRRPR